MLVLQHDVVYWFRSIRQDLFTSGFQDFWCRKAGVQQSGLTIVGGRFSGSITSKSSNSGEGGGVLSTFAGLLGATSCVMSTGRWSRRKQPCQVRGCCIFLAFVGVGRLFPAAAVVRSELKTVFSMLKTRPYLERLPGEQLANAQRNAVPLIGVNSLPRRLFCSGGSDRLMSLHSVRQSASVGRG